MYISRYVICVYLIIHACLFVCLPVWLGGCACTRRVRHSVVCTGFRSALGILAAEVVLAATVRAVAITEPAEVATASAASTVMAKVMATRVQAAGAATQAARGGRLMLVVAVAMATWAVAVAMAWHSA